MFRFIGAAVAVAVGIWAVLRRQRPRHGHRPLKDRTNMEIDGQPPRVTVEPDELEGRPGTRVVWVVNNKTDLPVKVGMRGFVDQGKHGHPPPLQPVEETVPARTVRDLSAVVLGTARKSSYKYDIHLNGSLAVDPIILIYD